MSNEPDAEFDELPEAIDPQEVDRVLSKLDLLIERVVSESIREILEDACVDIAALVEDEEEYGDEEDFESDLEDELLEEGEADDDESLAA